MSNYPAPVTCAVCRGTKVVVDGNTTFPCHACKPKQGYLSPVDAVIYSTTYALVLDRKLQAAWADPLCCNTAAAMENAERVAVKDAVLAAANAVQHFHGAAKAIDAGWNGTDVAKLYDAAGGKS